jgi:hypothetical protein
MSEPLGDGSFPPELEGTCTAKQPRIGPLPGGGAPLGRRHLGSLALSFDMFDPLLNRRILARFRRFRNLGCQRIQIDVISQIISERLRPRLSATRRIGCSHRLTRLDPWLRGDVIAKFFVAM